MALVIRNGRAYFLESFRQGKRVTSRCAGTGEFALLVADFRRLIQSDRETLRREVKAMRQERMATRRHEQSETRRLRDRLTSADKMVAGYFRRVATAIDRNLSDLGFHRHDRGSWRRKRFVPVAREVKRLDVRELAQLAREGDRMALGTLSDRFPAWLHETVANGHGELNAVVETALIEQLGPGHGALHKDAVAARLAIMRDELAPPGSSPLESLLAERVAICWLHVQLMEEEAVAYAGDLANIRDPIRAREMDRRAVVVDRRLARAQSRYIQALTALAKIRKLSVPIVIGQLNVSDNAINVAAQKVD